MEENLSVVDTYKFIINHYMSREEDVVTDSMKNDLNYLYNHICNQSEEIIIEVSNFIKNGLQQLNKFETTVYWYSFLIKINRDAQLFCEFLSFLLLKKEIEPTVKYFLFYQLKAEMFNYKSLENQQSKSLIWEYFVSIYNGFQKFSVLKDDSYISPEERNSNLILVITEQFLTTTHGPTKTALDRCETIIKHMQKQAVLFNTGEVLSEAGAIPYFGVRSANYISELINMSEQSWKGVKIPYIQFSKGMPDIDVINEILLQIKALRPLCIIHIGGNSILANLCNNILPVISIGLSPSVFEYTCTQFITIGRNITTEDEELLNHMGIKKKRIIESIFTSGLKPQESFINKKQLGIPEDKFIVAVIGGRLDYEITKEFATMINSLKNTKILVTFIGGFRNYAEFAQQMGIDEKSMFLGFQEDMLAVLENIDLYINPLRQGGGTSAVEALFKGIPVVTLPYGDVAANVGDDFCVQDYEQMVQKINEYVEDSNFYTKMAKKAKKRSEILLNTDVEFERIIKEVLERERVI